MPDIEPLPREIWFLRDPKTGKLVRNGNHQLSVYLSLDEAKAAADDLARVMKWAVTPVGMGQWAELKQADAGG